MAEEFQAEVCGGTWWSSPRTTFTSSPFMGSYGGCWQNEVIMNMKTRSTDESSGGCATTISPDSAFQTPSTTTNWNQALLVNGTSDQEGYNQTLSEILNIPAGMNQEQASTFITSSGDCTGNLVSTSYGYPTSLLQNLLCSSPAPPPPLRPAAPVQQPLYGFQTNLDDIGTVSSMPRGLHLANKTPFWNTSALDLNDNRAGFFTSSQSRFVSSMYEEKPNCHNIKTQNKEIRDMGSSVKKSSGEPTFKRQRLETPSPLPTFKVRKEKLGDRVTALQQLVSPFGKTDTASVLHEAIEYIKHLHDQVNVLSTPYMKNGATMQVQQINDKMKDNPDGAKQQDLRSRGLCLVPVSSTFPVATEIAPEYWTPSFGSTFK
ncbi:putative transcription factor bHLH family [Helianthus annuus]|uniref:Putative basic helix-loop-helix (BHLH) DNA-binding superfamily protein n=2 Tax=Helianthus annuus TaxID=4232 RepID=A0A251SA39_HELAN|nr:transcription factor bHLH112 isoform X1 [Helianthus annuus]KAF5765042.1 putative transcription factor bHLH family [Helianthus annuus]KAJ0456244.1 putative transcription factor bHLH family [Helianthus annuus]KAJ0693622.1 putative transcription factor bHLH family [Helianthus annuus]KAJ0831760.1 putative transcription factor bHLH family [Helianthus annuus]